MKTRAMAAKEPEVQVLSIVAEIKNTLSKIPEPEKVVTVEVNSTNIKETNKDKTNIVLKGKPKSGRFWKSNRERFLSINKTKGLKPDFQAKTALRIELKRTKELSKQVREQINQRRLVQKERRRENIRKTEENKKKSEIVQIITNTAKLKRMKKKQLRFIQKRDTNKEVTTSK